MDLLQEVQSHLGDVLTTGKSLDVRLLEKFDGQVTGVQLHGHHI